jgi:hypothetical protein
MHYCYHHTRITFPLLRARGSELYHTSYNNNKRDAAFAARALFPKPNSPSLSPSTKHAKQVCKFLLYRRSRSRERGIGHPLRATGDRRSPPGNRGLEHTSHTRIARSPDLLSFNGAVVSDRGVARTWLQGAAKTQSDICPLPTIYQVS